MKFDRLQASIINNADQSPSLYMALCMVESLFADIENACGTQLSQCSLGSDMLPSKLIWLCRGIQSIYLDNTESLQRNRARLDSVMGKLESTAGELQELQGISRKLEDRQAEYDALQRQLEERRADALAFEQLSDSCDQANRQLEELRRFDPDAAKAELARLSAEISALENQKTDLSALLEHSVSQSDGLRQEVEGLKQRNEDTLRQIDALNGQLQQGGSTAAQLQEQLDALQEGRTDLDAVRRELSEKVAAVRSEISLLERSKAELTEAVQQAQPRAQELRLEVEALRAEDESLRLQLNDLTEQRQHADEAVGSLRTELEDRKADLASLESVHRQLIQTKNETQEAFALLQTRVSTFREEELEPVQVQLEAVRQELAGLEQNKSELDQTYGQVKNTRNQMILDIARQKEENESLRGKLGLSRENLEALKLEKRKLDETLGGCLEELEKLQEEVSLLDAKKLPEARHLQQQEQQRREELLQSIAQAEVQRATFKEDIARLEERLPKLEEELRDERKVYDGLTASCTAKSSELESLERQIAELRSDNKEEKLEIYRKQLEETQRQLEVVQLECNRIRQETDQLQGKLESGQNERARLQDLKRRHESGLEVTQKQLRELEFAGSEKYIREVNALEDRVKLLENVRAKLGVSMSNMHRILGNAPVEPNIALEEQFVRDLRELRQRIDDMRVALLTCARSLKLEER